MFSRLLFLFWGLQLKLLSLALSPPLRAPLLLSSILLLLPFVFLLVDLLRDREPEGLEKEREQFKKNTSNQLARLKPHRTFIIEITAF